jgi:hypothetical protein
VSGYATGAIAASLIYVGYIISATDKIGTTRLGFDSRLTFAILFLVAGGFAATLLVTIVPWILAVSAYRKLRWFGQLYFPGVGALVLFVLGCTSASLAPKPLFVEDQTFLQGAAIAAQREGIGFLLAGLAFGACYWFFGERQIPSPSSRTPAT